MLEIKSGQVVVTDNSSLYVVVGMLIYKNKFNGLYCIKLDDLICKNFELNCYLNIKGVTNNIVNIKSYLALYKNDLYEPAYDEDIYYCSYENIIWFNNLKIYDKVEIKGIESKYFIAVDGTNYATYNDYNYIRKSDIYNIVSSKSILF